MQAWGGSVISHFLKDVTLAFLHKKSDVSFNLPSRTQGNTRTHMCSIFSHAMDHKKDDKCQKKKKKKKNSTS